MKRLLLVGSTGYLGQHIKNIYSLQGWSVSTLGRGSGHDLIADITSHKELMSLKLPFQFDRIILTAAVNEVEIDKDLSLSYAVNVTSTRLMLELAIKNKIKQFVYISTFHVYGKSVGVIGENSLCMPVSDYGLTHYLSEEIVNSLCRLNKLEFLILRPTNIYGCPVDIKTFNRWSLIPFNFVKSAIDNGKIEINSSGLQMRNFVDVIDVVEMTHLVGKFSCLNASGADNLNIREFASIVSETLKRNFNIECSVSWRDNDNSTSTLNVINNACVYHRQGDLRKFISNFTTELIKDEC